MFESLDDRAARLVCCLATLFVGFATASLGCAGSSTNNPPRISVNIGSRATFSTDEVVRIRVSAEDPDGDPLTFRVPDKPEDAELTPFPNRALFEWTLAPDDVTGDDTRQLTFVVTDDAGGRAERVVSLQIEPGNNRPRFDTSSSQLYDVTSKEPLSFTVRVEDPNDERVDLSMPPNDAPQGAGFEQTGPKEGEFSWDPTPAQESRGVHTATFVAEDGETDPVSFEVSIILKNRRDRVDDGSDPGGGGASCEELPLTHRPLSSQRSSDGYPIEAELTESAAQKYDLASALYTTRDPLNNGDVDFRTEELDFGGPNRAKIAGELPAIGSAADEPTTVFYAVCVLDQDAPDDADDKFLCAPGQGFHSFIAYPPGQSGCADDDYSIGGLSSAEDIATDRWKLFRACDGAPDFHTFEVEQGGTFEAYFSYPTGQDVSFELMNDASEPIDNAVERFPCNGLARVAIDAERRGAGRYYVRIEGDEIPYQTFGVAKGGSGDCQKDQLEPDGSLAEATRVPDNREFENLSICEADDQDVYLVELLPGDSFEASLRFTHADGNIDATLFSPGQEVELAPSSEGVASGRSTTDDEQLVYTAEERGLHPMLVWSENTANDYSLAIDTACRDADEFSGNHNVPDAEPVELKSYEDLKLCSTQPDWFERTGFSGSELTATVEIKTGPSADPISLTIHDSDGVVVAEGTADGDTISVSHTPEEQGQFYIKVSTEDSLLYDATFSQE